MGRWVGPILGLVACGAGAPVHEGAPAGGFDPGDVARRLEGSVTWAVDFGPAWEADGLSDCAYTRRYTGTEDRSVPWLCPECDVVFRVDVAMHDPDELACYASLTGSTPAPVEWVGWSDDGRYFRSPLEHYRLASRAKPDDLEPLRRMERIYREVLGDLERAARLAATIRKHLPPQN